MQWEEWRGGETILWGKRERKGKTMIGRLGVCVCVCERQKGEKIGEAEGEKGVIINHKQMTSVGKTLVLS